MTIPAVPRPHGTAGAGPVSAVWCGDPVREATCRDFIGRVEGVFGDGFYVSGPSETIFAVLGPRSWPGPLHLVTDGMAVLPAMHDRVNVSDGALVAGPLRVRLDGSRRWAPRLPERLNVDSAAWHGIAPDVDIDLAPVWEAVTDDARCGDVAAMFRRLQGRGAGLTPSGDDVLAGILLVCAMDPYCRGALADLALAARTTPLSRAFLTWAAAGQSIQPAHALLDAAASGDQTGMRRAAESLAQVGATSGRALVAGVALAATKLPCSQRPSGQGAFTRTSQGGDPPARTLTMVSRPTLCDAGQEII